MGLAYKLDPSIISSIEQNLFLYQQCLEARTARSLGLVIRNFTVGHDIFLHQRQRLLCLIRAMEVCFGSFNRPGKSPKLGSRIAKAFHLSDRQAPDVERQVESDLRQMRNALAHGAELSPALPSSPALHECETLLQDILRVGLISLMKLTLKLRLGAAYSKSLDSSPMLAFQQLLDSASKGDTEATQYLLP
jgi:hypothetical protein